MPDILVSELRGGRNGVDHPAGIPNTQCVDALNVDWSDNPLGRKRGGAVPISLAGGTAPGSAFVSLFRHVPDGDETAAELWGVTQDSPPLVKRLVGGTTWADVTLKDAITSRAQDVAACSFNGKLFFAFGSAVDRLHVWDPRNSKVRRVGLAAPGVPTITNTGSGSIPTTVRYYRVRAVDYSASTGITYRRSEPSPSVAFTPSGSGSAVRITKGTMPGEDETHWEVEVSVDNEVFYVIAGVENAAVNPVLIATSTFDDTGALSTWELQTLSEGIGQFDLPISARYLSTDGNRLLMAGMYNTSAKTTSRIWFTPVLGTTDHGDDERVPSTDLQKNWADLNEKDGGNITGLSYPIQGLIYVFKYRQTWRMVPTSIVTGPYLPKKISNTVGCLYFKSIVMMEDTSGNPAVGFMSYRGPYRMGLDGLIFIGRDNWDFWTGDHQSKVNLEAATMMCHAVYYYDLAQVWFYIAVDGLDSPSVKLCCDIRHLLIQDAYGLRGGWSRHLGKSCKAVCSVMFAKTIGASMSRDLVPYVGFREPV